jgi:hypothetical protein
MHRIVNGRGWKIHVREGELWLTQHRDARDHVVRAGESFTLDRDGTAIACAMRPSVITLGAPTPPRSALARAGAWLATANPFARLA